MQLNVMKTISDTRGKINPRYDATAQDLELIADKSRNLYELICNGFRFGYAQGYKARTAEFKKKGK